MKRQLDYESNTNTKKIKLIDDEAFNEKKTELNTTQNIYFSDEQYLKIFYNIHSFEDALDWINKRKCLPTTCRRILDCAWKAYK